MDRHRHKLCWITLLLGLLSPHMLPASADTITISPPANGSASELLHKTQQLASSKAQKGQPVTILLDQGTYFLDQTLMLTKIDSGTPEAPIVWKAKPGQSVRLTGGRIIPPSSMKKVTDKSVLSRLCQEAADHVRQVNLQELGITELGPTGATGRQAELFFDDSPMTPARWPDEGFARIAQVLDTNGKPVKRSKAGLFRYEGTQPQRWTDEPEILLAGYWRWDWAWQLQKIARIDTETKTISLQKPWHKYGYQTGQRFWATHVLAELSRPGEYYLDRSKCMLYFWPPESRNKGDTVLSVTNDPLVELKGASHIRFEGIVFECTRGTAVKISGGKGNQLSNCTVRNTGGVGVVVESCLSSGLDRCKIYNTGLQAIVISGGNRRNLQPGKNYVRNCDIHHFARVRRVVCGIRLGGVGNHIINNRIHNGPHIGIWFGGNDNRIEYNEISDLCQETGDTGAIYTGRDWTVCGNTIRHNFIHDIRSSYPGRAQGIYLDDCASGTIVLGNVLYKVQRAILCGGGRDNKIENNVIVECEESIRFDSRGLGWGSNHVSDGGTMPRLLKKTPYRQPPWSTRYPQLVNLLDETDRGAPKNNSIQRNLFSKSREPNLAQEVKELSTVQDNLSTDTEVRIESASASQLVLPNILPQDFKPIPFDQIGPSDQID